MSTASRRPRLWPHFLALVVALLAAAAAGAETGGHDHRPPGDQGGGSAEYEPFEATSTHGFEDVEHWTKVFESEDRDAWQKPEEVVAALELGEGARVADVGAGTGYFVPYLSAAVADGGAVLAVEIEPNLIVHLRDRAEREALSNVVPVLGSPDNPRLPPASVDVVLIVDTFHHIDERKEYFSKLRSALRPGGRVAVVDWRKRELPVGPPPSHKIEREHVIEEVESAGYRLVADHDFLDHQYFLVFRPL